MNIEGRTTVPTTKTPTWKNDRTSAPRIRVQLKSLAMLHDTMEYRGYTSGYQLAKAAGLTPGVVNHLVHGHRTTCSADTARAICEALRTPQDTLFLAIIPTVSENRERAAA